MVYGIYIQVHTREDRKTSFKFNNPFNLDYPLPIELSVFTKIAVGYKDLESDTPAKIKIFENEDEKVLLEEFYSFFKKLTEQSKIAGDHFVLGYNIKKYILPAIIKGLLVKHKIINSYDELPNIIKVKHLKPWDNSYVIDLMDEFSLSGIPVPLDYVKHYLGFEGKTIEEELNFLIDLNI